MQQHNSKLCFNELLYARNISQKQGQPGGCVMTFSLSSDGSGQIYLQQNCCPILGGEMCVHDLMAANNWSIDGDCIHPSMVLLQSSCFWELHRICCVIDQPMMWDCPAQAACEENLRLQQISMRQSLACTSAIVSHYILHVQLIYLLLAILPMLMFMLRDMQTS